MGREDWYRETLTSLLDSLAAGQIKPVVEVMVNDFDAPGLILDIGGGGEGIIGQMKGKQVVAIDPNRRELEEAADGPLKIVMDAGDMLFLDDVFDKELSQWEWKTEQLTRSSLNHGTKFLKLSVRNAT